MEVVFFFNIASLFRIFCNYATIRKKKKNQVEAKQTLEWLVKKVAQMLNFADEIVPFTKSSKLLHFYSSRFFSCRFEMQIYLKNGRENQCKNLFHSFLMFKYIQTLSNTFVIKSHCCRPFIFIFIWIQHCFRLMCFFVVVVVSLCLALDRRAM